MMKDYAENRCSTLGYDNELDDLGKENFNKTTLPKI